VNVIADPEAPSTAAEGGGQLHKGERRGRSSTAIYTSRIIKAGALLADTLTLLQQWDPASPTEANLQRFRASNLFAKATRARVEDILAIFRRRYVQDPQVAGALAWWVQHTGDDAALRRVLYFHAALADDLLGAVVTEVLGPRREDGQPGVSLADVLPALRTWQREGRMAGAWNEDTLVRVGQGVLATLRDFGLLEGVQRKRFVPFPVPPDAGAYVAFLLRQESPSGWSLLHDHRWRLLLLDVEGVERLLVDAHREGLLQYQAAGSVVRLDFPAADLGGYVRALVARAPAALGV
jgi:hypothetical protein